MCKRLYASRVHCRAGMLGRIEGGHERCPVLRRGHVALSDRAGLGLIGGGGSSSSSIMGGGLVGGLVDGSVFGRSVDRSVGSVLVGGLVGEVSSFFLLFSFWPSGLVSFSRLGDRAHAGGCLYSGGRGQRAVRRGSAPAGWGAATALLT